MHYDATSSSYSLTDDSTTSTTNSSTTNNQQVEVYVGYTFPARTLQTKYMYRLYSNGAIRYVPNGYGSMATTAPYPPLPDEYEEYFLNINSVEVKVTSIEDKSESFTYYDADYTLQTQITNKKLVYVTVNISGKADPVFAGKKVSAYTHIYRFDSDYGLSYTSEPVAVINEDGSFEISSIYYGQIFYIGENTCYSLSNVIIS